ncbi:MAG: ABC transporter permease [Armatimonadota bacterium]
MNFRRILRLIKKELLQTRRDKRMIMILFMSPVIQLFLFGYAVTTDINHISTAVYDEDRTAESRALVDRFVRSGYFDYKHYLQAPGEIDRLLDTGQTQLVLHIPWGFSKDLAHGRPAQVQAILDGTDSMSARVIAGYSSAVIREYSAGIILDRLQRNRGATIRLPQVENRPRVWYNPELKSVNFMVPGVLCMILLIVTMTMTSMAIVKEKEIGTLEQLVVTPISPYELIIGKTVPFLIIGMIDLLAILGVSIFWFHVDVAGSILLLIVLSALFLLTGLGLGIFISTISKTQHEATLTSFFFIFPSIILSGFIFPIANMPKAIQLITYAIPLRYFLTVVRGIFLKGSDFLQLWPEILIMALFGIGIMTLSALRFSKRLG